MLHRSLSLTAALFAVLALAACNSSGNSRPQAAAAEHSAPRLVTPNGFTLPNGPGCSGAADRFQALIDEDLEVGHTIKSVHAQMSAEIAHARVTCAAGNEGAARAEISASRSRHGYPAG